MSRIPPPTPEKTNSGATRTLTVLEGDGAASDQTALVARWPDAVAKLSDEERKTCVRLGQDTVIFHAPVEGDQNARETRGFVKCILRVPLGRPDAEAYAVFVEVNKDAYAALKTAFKDKNAVIVSGKLANRLPNIEETFGSEVKILEDGSDKRARVVEASHPVLLNGPAIGPLG